MNQDSTLADSYDCEPRQCSITVLSHSPNQGPSSNIPFTDIIGTELRSYPGIMTEYYNISIRTLRIISFC